MLLTIFTPTYNRGYTLGRLYKSLCGQTCNDFEWVIVDDGSTDGTADLIGQWINEKKIRISYLKKENGGKASAYNLGVKKAKGDLFVCVDSDDYLVDSSIEKVLNNWRHEKIKISDDRIVIGHIYFRISGGGKTITRYNGKEQYSTLLGFYRHYGLQGDTMLVYRTDIIKKYMFPVFEKEKFVPEAYIYDKYDEEGVLHIYSDKLYVGEYLSDGYTASMRKVNHDNPKGYEAYIKNRIKKDDQLLFFIIDAIKYVAIKNVEKDTRNLEAINDHKILKLPLLIMGWLFYKKVYSKYD